MLWQPIERLKEKMAAKARRSRIRSLLDKSKYDQIIAEELYVDGRSLGSGLGGEVKVVTIEGQDYALKETIYTEGTQEEEFAKNDVHFGTTLDSPLVLKYLGSHMQEAGLDESGKKQYKARILQPLADMDLHDALNDGHFHEPCTWPNMGKILRTFLKLVQAVEYMHSRNVVHLDLKHANVLVRNAGSTDPEVMLCDFGFCIQLNGPDAEHELASACGTDGYYAPEVVPGIWSYQRNRVSTACLRSDIYSLGVMLWEMITARQAMKKVTAPDGTRNLEKDPKFPMLSGSPWSTPMSVRIGGFKVLHQLDWLVRKMTRDDHLSRPTASQVVAELQEILQIPTMDLISHPDENHYAPPVITPPSPILIAPATPEKTAQPLLNTGNLYSPVTVDGRSECAVDDGSPVMSLPVFPPVFAESEPTTPLIPTSMEHKEPDSDPVTPHPTPAMNDTIPVLVGSADANNVSKSKDMSSLPSLDKKSTDSPRIAASRSTAPADPSSVMSPRIKTSLWSRLTGGTGSSGSTRTPASSGSEVSRSPACSQGEQSGGSTPTSQRVHHSGLRYEGRDVLAHVVECPSEVLEEVV